MMSMIRPVRWLASSSAGAALVLLSGCATIDQDKALADLKSELGQRIEQRIAWFRDGSEAPETAEEIEGLLGEGLTPESAVQIALLRNPKLQALYEDLGIANADVAQAHLVSNPTLGASVRLPDRTRSRNVTNTITREAGGGFTLSRAVESAATRNNIEFALVQSFLDVLMAPMKVELATAQYDRTKLLVTHEVLVLVADVKRAYFSTIASEQVAAMYDTVTEATGAASEFATRSYEAGNLNRLDMTRENALHAEALVAAAQARLDAELARNGLNEMLGLWGKETEWRFQQQRLPDMPAEEYVLDPLEKTALVSRNDLAASVRNLEMLVYGDKMARQWRWLGLIDLGVSTERDADGLYVTGPQLEVQLPLFDQGQARIATSKSQVRAGAQQVTALAIRVRYDVRNALTQLRAASDVVDFYQRVLLPAHETILSEAQSHQNGMLIGLYELLLEKQNQIHAGRAYVEALRNYWLARTTLEEAVGGRLPDSSDEMVMPDTVDVIPQDGPIPAAETELSAPTEETRHVH